MTIISWVALVVMAIGLWFVIKVGHQLFKALREQEPRRASAMKPRWWVLLLASVVLAVIVLFVGVLVLTVVQQLALSRRR